MKQLFLLLTVFALQSCVHYVQVLKTNSNYSKLEKDFYVFENDTVKITYYCGGEKGILSFIIFNKSDKPIYLDWRQCSFIDRTVKTNYWENKIQLNSFSSKSGVFNENIKKMYNEFGVSYTEAVKPERITFIPPKSNYVPPFNIFVRPLINEPLVLLDPEEKIVTRNGTETKKSKVLIKSYNRENSPVFFRNFLAFSFTEDFLVPFYMDNEFYIQEIQIMDTRHFRGETYTNQDGAIFYQYPYKDKKTFYIFY